MQKSQAVKAAVGRRACWIDGSVTAFGLYGQLYRHRDQPVVIDDVDGLFADRAAVRLRLTERWRPKRVSGVAVRVKNTVVFQRNAQVDDLHAVRPNVLTVRGSRTGERSLVKLEER